MENIPISPRCPIRTSFDLLGGKWQLLALDRIGGESLRFTEIKQRLHPISDKVLAQVLGKLTDNRLIRMDKGRYTLTEAGKASGPVLAAMVTFGREYENSLRD